MITPQVKFKRVYSVDPVNTAEILWGLTIETTWKSFFAFIFLHDIFEQFIIHSKL